MHISKTAATVLVALMYLSHTDIAISGEVRIACALGMQVVMDDIGPKFERATEHKTTIIFARPPAIVKSVQDGEPIDIVIAPQAVVDGFVKEGKAAPNMVIELARSGIGVVVRKGDPRPNISSPESLKHALLAAKAISYADPATGSTSGMHFAKVLDRLGIAEAIKPKTLLATKTDVGTLVANGEAEIGVQQLQEFVSIAGVEIVGPLPGDLQAAIVFAGAIMFGARDGEASRALIAFLRTPEATAVIKAKAMEPP